MIKAPENFSALKYWTKTIIADIVFYGSMILWLFYDIQNAGNVFMVILVFSSLGMLLIVLMNSDKNMKTTKPSDLDVFFRPRGFTTYHYLTDISAILILSWFGHFFLVFLYIIKFTLFEGFRNKSIETIKNYKEL